MIKLSAIGIVFVIAVGCGRGSDDKGGKSNTEVKEAAKQEGAADLEAFAKLKDELCACKDATCGKAADDKLTAKRKEMEATYASSHNKSIMHYAMETELAAKQCLMSLK